jgi:hypothetical protein
MTTGGRGLLESVLGSEGLLHSARGAETRIPRLTPGTSDPVSMRAMVS